MNKHILIVIDSQMNPDKYTQEQLDNNAAGAYAAYANHHSAVADYADDSAYAAAISCEVEHYLDEYFDATGENKQDYVDAVNKDNK